MQASGRFTVKITPQSEDRGEGSSMGRMLLEKTFQGDLEASSKGEMLTVGTDSRGSAAYVAVERVSGSLHGKAGSFALSHRGIMTRGAAELHISVVPDSGTSELQGISGALTIKVDAGQHFYTFEYTLPGTD